MSKEILLLGTLDSKGPEVGYLKQKIEERGWKTLVVDVGLLGPALCPADITQEEVAQAGGEDFSHMKARHDRSHSVEVMTQGAIRKVLELYSRGRLGGVMAVGGGTGTAIGTAVMRSLPFGVPKVMISTVASRDVRDYVGTSDILMYHSVVDLAGLNSLAKAILERAAGAVTGMAEAASEIRPERPLVAVTSFGICPLSAERAGSLLAEKGYEMVTFHANGVGGRALEELAEQGLFAGILDFVTHEFADQLYGGYCSGIGPERLSTGVRKGVPLIVVPGGLDCIVFNSAEDVPEKLKGRRLYHHDVRVAVRTAREELELIARTMAERLAGAKGPVGVLIPLKGWSEADKEGEPLFDPLADEFFIEALEHLLPSEVPLKKVNRHISDPEFVRQAVDWLDELIRSLS